MEDVSILRIRNKKIKMEYIEYGEVAAGLIILSSIAIYLSVKDYIMFHTLIELGIMNLAFIITFISKNTYRISTNSYFTFFGIFYAAIAIFNAIHLFHFKGHGAISANIVNDMAMQAGAIVDIIQGISLLISTMFLHKKINVRRVIFIYFFMSVFLGFTVFYWRVFPSCYNTSLGCTMFKKSINIAISICLLTSIIILNKSENRKQLHPKVHILINLSIIFTLLSQVSFIFCKFLNENYGAIGHICKLFSFYLMYKAVSETSLKAPYKILFYELSQANSKLKCNNIELQRINKELKREIQERKATEEALRESEERYKLLVELCPDAIVAYYGDEIFFANKYAAKMLGFDNIDELKRKSLKDFISPSCRKHFEQEMYQIRNNFMESPLLQKKLIKCDGNMIDVEAKASFIPYNRKEAVLVVLRDIEERKKAEENEKLLNEAMEYDKVKNEFFANISHELRTPINVIFGVIQLVELYLKKDLLQENIRDVKKYTNIMKQNCYRLLRLVNNFIDITKIDSGFLNLDIQNNNIVSIVEDITLSVVEYAKNKEVYIEFDTDVEEKIMACDPDKIERIVLNLLSNCIKFTREGDSVRVNIMDKGTSVILTVEDNGIGIPKDKLNVIFDRFRQVDKSFARNHEGSGIGLSLVKSMVEMHEGSVSVESEYGEGSKFIIELPVKILKEEKVAVESVVAANIERINIEFSDIYS